LKRTLGLALAVLTCVASAYASPVFGTSATMSGSTGATGFGDWANNFTLAWDITQNALDVDLFDYEYTFTVGPTGSDLSHIVIGFSTSCATDRACITNGTDSPDGPRTYNALAPPNREMPAAIFGVKFTGFSGSGPYTFSFTSDRAPVWHDFYARDGGNAYAYNSGLTNHLSESVLDFIAAPNGIPGGGGGGGGQVPEPGSMILIGGGLVALAVGTRKRLAKR
jgi:hypothetical protein